MEFEYFTPKWLIFGLLQLGIIDYIFIENIDYYCAKFYTNISTNMDTTNIFQFLSIFTQNFYYSPPQISNFGPIQLDIIAYIVSKAKNYNYAKFHAFIKNITIDVIFRLI